MKFHLIIGLYLIHAAAASILVYNLTNLNKLVCHSCEGDNCQKVPNEDDGMVVCNKRAQLCWAGYINHKPYRTCASRYCTPLDISLDSDVRIETCCRSNLCNSIDLPLPAPTEGYSKSFPIRSKASTLATILPTTEQSKIPTTVTPILPSKSSTVTKMSKHVDTSQFYIVNEIVDDGRGLSPLQISNNGNSDSHQEGLSLQQLANDDAGDWKRIPYQRYYFNHVESVMMSKCLVFIMPFFLNFLLK